MTTIRKQSNTGRVLLIATGLLVIFWMLVIGSFSAQTGESSAGLSRQVAERAVDLEETLTGRSYSTAEHTKRVDMIHIPIRKLAHMTEYAILVVLLELHFFCGRRRFLLLGWGIATAYAVTDELHQLFVDGRSGSVRDVCIDSAGACIGAIVVFLCGKLLARRKR